MCTGHPAAESYPAGRVLQPSQCWSSARVSGVGPVEPMTVRLPDAPNVGTFVATGEAVDDGILCPSGDVVDLGVEFTGGRKVQRIIATKKFTCGDGTGAFVVRLKVRQFPDQTETFDWVIQGGSGEHEGLRGGGSGHSTLTASGEGGTNYYDGSVID